MVPDYFEGAFDRYSKDQKKKKESKNKPKEFKGSSKRYKKRDMEIEIVEYEIKD